VSRRRGEEWGLNAEFAEEAQRTLRREEGEKRAERRDTEGAEKMGRIRRRRKAAPTLERGRLL
jgi:hypothetical protein